MLHEIDRLATIKSSVIPQDFVHGADYAALAEAANTFRGLLGEGARVVRGEGRCGASGGRVRRAQRPL